MINGHVLSQILKFGSKHKEAKAKDLSNMTMTNHTFLLLVSGFSVVWSMTSVEKFRSYGVMFVMLLASSVWLPSSSCTAPACPPSSPSGVSWEKPPKATL